jgi:pyruvate dehydrogenase E2 component (dihydrolipoamide acetyltransferase)
MRHTIKLPRVAETVDSVVVMEWLVAPGDRVAAEQPIMRVETDKALVEVPAPIGGTVVELLVDPDAEISTGHPILIVEGA